MFLKQDSSFILQAQLTSTVASSQVKISVTYKDNTNEDYSDVIVDTNNTTAVTLLAAPPTNTVNLVELIKIYNPDTQANTVEILAGTTVVYACTIEAGQSVILSEVSGNGFSFTPLAVNGDGSELTGITTAQITDTADKRFVTDAEKANYGTAYENSHTHSNKTLLDSLISSGDGNSYLANDGTYKSIIANGLLQIEDLGVATSDLTLDVNKINIAYIADNLTISLPTTGFTNGVENKCTLYFTTTDESSPTISTTGTLRWSNKNSGIAPSSFSTITGVRNVLTFITHDAGTTWEAEYKTYGGIVTPFVRPNLTANGTLGGSTFAVASTAINQAAWNLYDISGPTCSYSSQIHDDIFYNPNPLNVTALIITYYPGYGGLGCSIYASQDGITWTFLRNYSDTADVFNIDLSMNTEYYKYYKITTTSARNDGTYWCYTSDINFTATYIAT